ncbi:MAG: hypothetical protein LPK07_12295 [Hymenobacteraceae bacterium]|nr:hypothetical protein [Hymenobacteraceae bacterium]MDX5482453.1 hypothetical protein [Hymenobacteraceae bacterium]
MVFVTAGILLAGTFISWAFYKVVVKKNENMDDVMAGAFFVIIFFTVLFFLLRF